jgi:hypothetical protein
VALQPGNPVAGQGAPLSAAPEPVYAVTGLAVGAGATVTLTGVNGAAQASVARRTAYDLQLQFQAGASPSFPFATARLQWFDQTGDYAIAEEDWTVPMGSSTDVLRIRGSGPMRGALMQVQLVNLDSETDTLASLTLYASSRPQTGSDWRHNPQTACPGYATPTAGAGFDNCLGSLSSVSLLPSTSAKYLLGLFAGNVFVRAQANNATAGMVNFALRANVDNSGYNTLMNDVSGSGGEILNSMIFPRAAVELDITNNDPSDTAALFFIATAQPIS